MSWIGELRTATRRRRVGNTRLGIVKERKQEGIMVLKAFMSRVIESGFRRKEGEGKKRKSRQGKEGKIGRWKVKLIFLLFNLLKIGADKTTWK